MAFTSNRRAKPTRIAGVEMPPGVAPGSSTSSFVTNPKTGKRELVTRVHVPSTISVGRTNIDHIPAGPYSPEETAAINKARHQAGAPVIKTADHPKTLTSAAIPVTVSELARSLGADANKAGAAQKAGKAYAAEEERAREARRVDDLRVRTNVSVVDAGGRSTTSVPLGVRGPKQDRS